MNYSTVARLIKNSFKKKLIYSKTITTMFVFIYKERHINNVEIIDMSQYLGKEITDKQAVTEYKNMLDDFNKGLRPNEHKRTYVRGYRESHKIILNKLILKENDKDI